MNKEEFCEELKKILNNELDEDFPQENTKTIDFIEGMKAWLEDTDGGKNFFEDFHERKISYRDLVKLIRAAGMYE